MSETDQIGLDLNCPTQPFRQAEFSKASYRNSMIVIKDVKIFVNMYKKYQIESFPSMSKVSKFRRVVDTQLPVSKRQRYWVHKTNSNGEEFGEEDVIKTLRYGKSILRPKEETTLSRIDGVETILGSEATMAKEDRRFVVKMFVKKENIPLICFTGNTWDVEPMKGSEVLYRSLNDMMCEKGVVGVAEFVMVKGYSMKNIAVIPTERGLVANEIPWGGLITADGLLVKSVCDDQQVEWMMNFVSELPQRDELRTKNPMLERLWINVLSREQNTPLNFELPIESQPSVSKELCSKINDLFQWCEVMN